MKSILVYGDSLSWGIEPGTRRRLEFSQRWPGVCEATLRARGQDARVIEDCLNGRRTVWEDPFKAGRNGREGLRQRMEVNSPLDLVLLMLGTNDFQFNQPFVEPWAAAQGVATLVQEMRLAPIEPGMAVPEIVVICPPAIRSAEGPVGQKFRGAEARCVGLSVAYEAMAGELGCRFFDAGAVVRTSEVDGVHLEAAAHLELGTAIGEWL
jgi:lysophospholipase L1-like esterase